MSLGGIGEILVSSIVQVIMFSIVPLIWWFLTARDKESFFHWIGLKKPRIKGSMIQFLLIILGVVGAYLLIIALVMARLLGDTETATTQFTSQGWGALLKILIYAIVQTGLSEEILFRGFIGRYFINLLRYEKRGMIVFDLHNYEHIKAIHVSHSYGTSAILIYDFIWSQ